MPHHPPGLLGSAVIGGKITNLIDLHALVASAGENWLAPSQGAAAARRKVLLLDTSAVARDMIHEFLDFSGYEVTQASSLSEAIPKIQPVDAVVIVAGIGAELVAAMRRDRALDRIPVLRLFDRPEPMDTAAKTPDSFDAWAVRSERGALLQSLAGLSKSETHAWRSCNNLDGEPGSTPRSALATSSWASRWSRCKEVIRYQEMTVVPLAPGAIKGLINLRGQIVIAIDTLRSLGLPSAPQDALPMNIVSQSEDGVVSLLVDEIGDVIDVPLHA